MRHAPRYDIDGTGDVIIRATPDIDVQGSPAPFLDIRAGHVGAQVDAWHRDGVEISHDVARVIASWYHSPSAADRAITALSHGVGFMVDRLEGEVRGIVGRLPLQDGPTSREELEVRALLDYVRCAVRSLTAYRRHVDTAHWHRFVDTDTPDTEQCLTCGGAWLLRPIEGREHVGEYVANDGRPAGKCSGDTSRVHGETPCGLEECGYVEATCVHTDHDCNCIHCLF